MTAASTAAATTNTMAPVANMKPRKRAMPRMLESETLPGPMAIPKGSTASGCCALLTGKRARCQEIALLDRHPNVHVGCDCGETMKPPRPRHFGWRAGPLSRRRRPSGPLGDRRRDSVRGFSTGRADGARRAKEAVDRDRHRLGGLGAPLRRRQRVDVLGVREIAEFDEHRGKIRRFEHGEAGRTLGVVVEPRRALQLRDDAA